jgi:hypothetical protein
MSSEAVQDLASEAVLAHPSVAMLVFGALGLYFARAAKLEHRYSAVYLAVAITGRCALRSPLLLTMQPVR